MVLIFPEDQRSENRNLQDTLCDWLCICRNPMVHSGAVVASNVSRSSVRDDKTRRHFVACGAAAGVCTAFSAPIGGVLFSLEERGRSNVPFRTFFCSMCSIATLYSWNAWELNLGKPDWTNCSHLEPSPLKEFEFYSIIWDHI